MARPVKRRTEEVDFLYGMGRWLDGMGFSVGLGAHELDDSQATAIAKGLLPVVGTLVGLGPFASLLGGLVQGGESAEQVKERLEPIAQLCDLIGLKTDAKNTELISVVLADSLTTEALVTRLTLLRDFGRSLEAIGFRIPVLWPRWVRIQCLFVFFDSDACAEKQEAIVSQGFLGKGEVWVRAQSVDVPARSVTEAAAHGPSLVGEFVEDLGLQDQEYFDTENLCQVLALGANR
ncbi:MAG TPA: hypothetical protein VK988_10685 [Acidimicrobiales bacterium]|nr:hypothetical protein [Acidimicrobiales bacterium]